MGLSLFKCFKSLDFSRALKQLPSYRRNVLSLFSITAITFYGLVVAGCASSALPSVFLTAFTYRPIASSQAPGTVIHNVTSSNVPTTNGTRTLQIRAGYYGMCIRSEGISWDCSRDVDSFSQYQSLDPLDLIALSQQFKTKLLFPAILMTIMIIAFAQLSILQSFPAWHKEITAEGEERMVQPFPNPALLMALFGLSSVAVLLAFVAILWQHIAAVTFVTTMENMAQGLVTGEVGTMAMTLSWLGVLFLAVVCTLILVLVASIAWLGMLTEDDDDDDDVAGGEDGRPA